MEAIGSQAEILAAHVVAAHRGMGAGARTNYRTGSDLDARRRLVTSDVQAARMLSALPSKLNEAQVGIWPVS